ncbi:hypothetical protein LCGC14_1062240 [marine sediment metagenome]|uniref:Uncharacterized protein n=1 Tax=marine sediment metagenome TaxID=412755 RepID=A0A0F9MQC7_9ZZZZ
MINKEEYFHAKAKLFAVTVNRLITAFMMNKERYDSDNHFKYWLILMGLIETAYIIEERND